MTEQFIMAFDKVWASATFIVATLFVLYYGLFCPWYRTPFGRSIIILDFAVAFACMPTAIWAMTGWDFESNVVLEWLTVVVAVQIPIAIGYRLCVLWGVRHKNFWKKLDAKRGDKDELDGTGS